MLDKMAPHGYVRNSSEAEEAEYGRGYVAVLDEDERWFSNHQDANAALIKMRAGRIIDRERA